MRKGSLDYARDDKTGDKVKEISLSAGRQARDDKRGRSGFRRCSDSKRWQDTRGSHIRSNGNLIMLLAEDGDGNSFGS
jgi:hypothetical protein